MNTPITGTIYHVVDKTTGDVVKVGSTVRPLTIRWSGYDKKKYSNHFLRTAKEISSSDNDFYDPKDLRCPFLWHLVAAEQMEIFRMGTFQKTRLSNILLPLFQKMNCFDHYESVLVGASLGGKISGALSRDNKTGIHDPNFDRGAASRKGGLKNVESGHLQKISSAGGKVSGKIQGAKHAANKTGFLSRSPEKMASDGRKIGLANGKRAMHNRWHVNRGMTSPNCAYCAQV